MTTPKDTKVRAIRRDVVIDNSNPEPIPELVKELVYAASDMGIEPIYKIVGDSVNYPMMISSLDVARDEYFQTVVIPSIRKRDLGEDLDE